MVDANKCVFRPLADVRAAFGEWQFLGPLGNRLVAFGMMFLLTQSTKALGPDRRLLCGFRACRGISQLQPVELCWGPQIGEFPRRSL